ncbi:MAG: hypothetical protein QOK38_1561, partial [Acidobacteriaceae bacterium]|nr:hypothetical protein [Acidobacteriaceae bacterium]
MFLPRVYPAAVQVRTFRRQGDNSRDTCGELGPAKPEVAPIA